MSNVPDAALSAEEAVPKPAVGAEQPRPRQWELLSFVPIVAGLYWLLGDTGFGWLFWALVPGGFLLATGVAQLFIAGDPRIHAYMACAAFIGMVFSLPAWIVSDGGTALFVLLGSIASFLAAGRIGLVREPQYVGATPPQLGTQLDAKAGLDEAVLGYFLVSAQVPSGDLAVTMCEEAFKLEEAIRARGWDQDASGMHPAPPVPEKTYVSSARCLGHDYDIVSFDSGYNPDDRLPGAALWKSYEVNNRCHVRVMRHPGGPRPWLLCVHGYRMGLPLLDFSLFSPAWLHDRLGLNIIQPVLPLHGPRAIGWRTGDYYLDGDLLDLMYAQAQALWDLRRTLAWLRATEDKPRVGAYGFSLGGYNAALLANYDDALDFVVAAIPVVDYARALWRYMPGQHMQFFNGHGLDEERYRRILEPVSPLSRRPRVARERLSIIGAAGDRIVVPYHPLKLAAHWDVPVTWYQGSHLSVRNERETGDVLRNAIATAGWAGAQS